MLSEMKTCPMCKRVLKRYVDFCQKKGRAGGSTYCRKCDTLYVRAKTYHITVDELREWLKTDCCDLCGKEFSSNTEKQIDHDHKTDVIRGVLCKSCNTGLGKLGDTVESLRKAIRYLERS